MYAPRNCGPHESHENQKRPVKEGSLLLILRFSRGITDKFTVKARLASFCVFVELSISDYLNHGPHGVASKQAWETRLNCTAKIYVGIYAKGTRKIWNLKNKPTDSLPLLCQVKNCILLFIAGNFRFAGCVGYDNAVKADFCQSNQLSRVDIHPVSLERHLNKFV